MFKGAIKMLLKDVADQLNITKRAIKLYEEKGLIKVKKDENGYRNYSTEDIDALHKISIYRKLGISLKDIKRLLNANDDHLLLEIYAQKQQELVLRQHEITELSNFIQTKDYQSLDMALDYQDIAKEISSLLPGAWGEYLRLHFMPFLQITIHTKQQREALDNIIKFCDDTRIKIPLLMQISMKLSLPIMKHKSAQEMIAQYRDISSEEYQQLKQQVLKGAKMKMGIMKYHPIMISQRKLMRNLQACGYNDIFIPNLMKLSFAYAEYKQAFDKLNERICLELGLYYDNNFNLCMKKQNDK